MFRPERMSETSVICLKKDVDQALDILSNFGDFHIEELKGESKFERYGKSIQQIESVIENLDALINELKIGRIGLLDVFKEEHAKMEIVSEDWQTLMKSIEKEAVDLKKEADSILNSIRSLNDKLTELQHLQEILRLLERFKLDLKALERLRFIYTIVATVPSRHIYEFEESMKNYPAIFYHRPVSKDKDFIFIASSSKYGDEIEKIVKTHHAETFQIPLELPEEPTEALKEVNFQSEKALEEKERALESLEKFTRKNRLRILALREIAENILLMLKAKQSSMETERLIVIKGYVPKSELSKLREEMYEKLKRRALVIEKEASSVDPPTLIRNPPFVKPFEIITRLYGVPHYDEIDPTPLIALTFPLIFGLMFGDVGHGLVLVTIGTALGLFIKRDGGLQNFAWILAACGIGSLFAGLLFGEFFGKPIIQPLWFSPFENVTKFLILSLFVGIIQILSGFIIDFINLILRREIVEAFLTSMPKMLFYLGSIYLVMTYHLNFELWLNGPVLFPLIPLIFLIFGKPLASKILKPSRSNREKPKEQLSLLERFFEASDLVTRLLSNTISYARILALLMAHWALILVTYTLADMVFSAPTFGTILGYIIIVGGNIFVIAFEGLIVFIHTLRLHFYEWFSKFYQGTGVEFSPYKQNFKYAKIVFKR